MSREIKFRVWDKTYGRWMADIHKDVEENTMDYLDIDHRYWPDEWYPMSQSAVPDLFAAMCKDEDLIVEQYTGLHDAQGREIYEGDIISPKDERTYLKQVIEWSEIEPGDDMDMESYGYHLNPYWGDIVVIGNIHEDPDLVVEHAR